MATALKNWLYGTPAAHPASSSAPSAPPPDIIAVSPPPSDDEGEETEKEDDDDDAPPAFPALASAQRAAGSSPSPLAARKKDMAPPSILRDGAAIPALPDPRSLARPTLGVPQSRTLGVPPAGPSSGGGMLSLPPTTMKPPTKPSKKRDKVALAPGCGPLDWANLKASGADLRGVDSLVRVTPSMLKQHNKRDDAWSAFNGKVYNITDYLRFHPGGEKELMRVAGRDGTKLFALTHAWVNVDYMLDVCMVGFLVGES